MVELLDEAQDPDGLTWVHVRVVQDDREGWILASLLLIATPEPNWYPLLDATKQTARRFGGQFAMLCTFMKF